VKKNVAGELEEFRQSRKIPELLSKEFVGALNPAERTAVVVILCEELRTASVERVARLIGQRVARVNKFRKEKGEL
jgi:hypothetical protein